MPIYEYKCENCGNHMEIFQKINEAPLEVCSLCNGRLVKLISNCSFQLKGTGWYITDYKKKGSDGTEEKGKKDQQEKKENKDK